jgi:hypothetical protein
MDKFHHKQLRALWEHPDIEARIESGIRSHRQGDLRVFVTDMEGTPISGVPVSFSQTDNEFLLGIGDMDITAREPYCGYFDLMDRICNSYHAWISGWSRSDPRTFDENDPNKPCLFSGRSYMGRVLPFKQKYGKKMYAAQLFSDNPNWLPRWLPYEEEQLVPLIEKRMRIICNNYAEHFDFCTVVNESVIKYDQGKRYRFPDFFPRLFKMADQYLPKRCRRLVNFFNPVWQLKQGEPSEEYLIVSELLERGLPVDVFGLQLHLYEPPAHFYISALAGRYYSPQHIFQVLDYYSTLGLPFYITEITIPHENETPEADEFQAYFMRNILRLFFSYPSVLAAQLWNTVSEYREVNKTFCEHIFYKDRIEGRAAYRMLDHLWNNEWRTDEIVKTDAAGIACCSAFYGNYKITINWQGNELNRFVSFNKKSTPDIRFLL